jgi:hypothetical protein
MPAASRSTLLFSPAFDRDDDDDDDDDDDGDDDDDDDDNDDDDDDDDDEAAAASLRCCPHGSNFVTSFTFVDFFFFLLPFDVDELPRVFLSDDDDDVWCASTPAEKVLPRSGFLLLLKPNRSDTESRCSDEDRRASSSAFGLEQQQPIFARCAVLCCSCVWREILSLSASLSSNVLHWLPPMKTTTTTTSTAIRMTTSVMTSVARQTSLDPPTKRDVAVVDDDDKHR